VVDEVKTVTRHLMEEVRESFVIYEEVVRHVHHFAPIRFRICLKVKILTAVFFLPFFLHLQYFRFRFYYISQCYFWPVTGIASVLTYHFGF
jgi:hypothetical protein